MRTREGDEGRQGEGRLRGKAPKLSAAQETHLVGLYRVYPCFASTRILLVRFHDPC